jgi:hypothetical protein
VCVCVYVRVCVCVCVCVCDLVRAERRCVSQTDVLFGVDGGVEKDCEICSSRALVGAPEPSERC